MGVGELANINLIMQGPDALDSLVGILMMKKV